MNLHITDFQDYHGRTAFRIVVRSQAFRLYSVLAPASYVTISRNERRIRSEIPDTSAEHSSWTRFGMVLSGVPKDEWRLPLQ